MEEEGRTTAEDRGECRQNSLAGSSRCTVLTERSTAYSRPLLRWIHSTATTLL